MIARTVLLLVVALAAVACRCPRCADADRGSGTTEDRRIAELTDELEDLEGEYDRARLELQLLELQEKYDRAMLLIEQYTDKYGVFAAYRDFSRPVEWVDVPAIAGRVMSVDREKNIIVLSVGRNDRVRAGFEFTLYRGDTYVGKVIIDDVQKEHCSGYSKRELESKPIEKGDEARTRW